MEILRNLTFVFLLAEKAAAYLLPFGNLLVTMKAQSLELHSVKNRLGGRRFNNAGKGGRRFCPKPLANERIRIVRIAGSPPINDNRAKLQPRSLPL